MNRDEAAIAAIRGAEIKRPHHQRASVWKDGCLQCKTMGQWHSVALEEADDWQVVPKPPPEPKAVYERLKVGCTGMFHDYLGVLIAGEFVFLDQAPRIEGFGGWGFDLPSGSHLTRNDRAWIWLTPEGEFRFNLHVHKLTPNNAIAAGWTHKHADCVWVRKGGEEG